METRSNDSQARGEPAGPAPVPLRPRPRVWARLVVLGLLVAFVLISRPSLFDLTGFTLATALLLGTYPETTVDKKHLEKRFRVFFVPLRARRWSIDDCSQIETDVEPHLGAGWAVLIGVWNWLWCQVMDRLLPWIGGDYKLWFRTYRGGRIAVWQGNGESNFQANLEILESVTGLPVTRG